VLHFTDTMWLNVLTALILDRGKTPASAHP
jgi:hypothetical protein